jgi:hypothetical protein
MATELSTPEESLDEAEIHDVLRNDRRRLTIRSLQEAEDGSLSLRDLAEQVAALETGESPPPRDKRQSVYVSLQQTHLPKLEGLGIVEYDTEEKSVSLRDRVQEVEVYMEVVPQYGLSWGEYYFTLGLVGLLTTIAVALQTLLFGDIPALFVASFFFVVLMVSAGYHVYSQQDRVLFQRLRS